MSLPPATVKIKRKATDDPVEYLRIHEATGSGKRPRQGEYIFSRQAVTNDTSVSQFSSPFPRKIKGLPQPSSAPISHDATQSLLPTNTIPFNAPVTTQPRRFHISKSAITSNDTNAEAGGGRKRKAQPTVFVERRIRPKSADGTPGGTPAPEETGGRDVNSTDTSQVPDTSKEPQQKKPGQSSRSATPVRPMTPPKASPAPLRNVVLPNGTMMPWDVSSERLAAEMQAYTLQEIGKTLAAHDTPRPSPASRRIKTPSKFKPKPALRYLERHPEHKAHASTEGDEEYVVEEVDDESEYIIDTYIRVPAYALEAEDAHKNIGLLILESQPDIDEFYREDDESSEEEDDGDEDENAENHYTADYPDEEVDSDDEFDLNAYHYRNRNASDLEEFDEDDATFSDDESEATKYPWMTKPWVKKPTIDRAVDGSD
ncbi:uncharacterized protein RSE6_00105 [Rhynchosporium secalis]|uniref:Transcription factor Iwr1 domain-containing protein n=1 Tax=Rhynchosporium secalis TaxID=38038 RepID=A0A1E1LUD2_RHYSE|nr:uncharacterized protein RSE6_00105 [Rhynchosporium secalis]